MERNPQRNPQQATQQPPQRNPQRKLYLLAFLVCCSAALFAAYSNIPRQPVTRSGGPARRVLLIYMNGSDLESRYKAASGDLAEMRAAPLDPSVDLLLYTGGCKRWHTPGIPDNTNAIFQLQKGRLYKLADMGQASMGDPATLAGFLQYAGQHFPAKEYSLIFWNHGGGAITGYGADERYAAEAGAMKLADIDRALAQGGLGTLEFVGFDTCLMSTLELADILQAHARYMIASEEVEPEQGWDYAFLGKIRPGQGGAEIGRAIIDAYQAYYEGRQEGDIATLALTDLSQLPALTEAFEAFAGAASSALRGGRYSALSRARGVNRAFGGGGEDGETDMIDVAGLAASLEGLFPGEAARLAAALARAVPYAYDSFGENLGGLSVYFPFANKENLDYNLEVYASMGRLPMYTAFVREFSAALNAPNPQEDLARTELTLWEPAPGLEDVYLQVASRRDVALAPDGTVPEAQPLVTTLNGRPACLYDTNNSALRRYTIPARLNGQDANLIAVYDDARPDGAIVGAIPTGNGLFNSLDKKLVTIKKGDRVALRYYALELSAAEVTDYRQAEAWFVGEEFVADGPLRLDARPPAPNLRRALNRVDTRNNNHFVLLTP